MRIKIYAGGKIKNSVYEEALKTLVQRITFWRLDLQELSEKQFDGLSVSPRERWIGLTEQGRSFSSSEFSLYLDRIFQQGQTPVFFIGEASGLPEKIMNCAHDTLSLGAMTWPHLLARVLLIEQIYRAQQRTLNHPYSFV